MNNYRCAGLANPELAFGMIVKFEKGEHQGKRGRVFTIYTSIFTKSSLPVLGIGILDDEGNDTHEDVYLPNTWDAPFVVDVTLEEGKKYVTEKGNVVTMHEQPNNPGRFFVNYSEVCDDPRNTCTESYESNGFAYHYDCGMNILKEYIED